MLLKDLPAMGARATELGALPPSERVRVRRFHERGAYDRASVLRTLDAGFHCNVAFVVDGEPVVIPTLYWRDSERLYFHGSRASRMMRAAQGRAVCVSVTLLDGLVLTRSAFHHSANYRSVILFGIAEPVEESWAIEQALKAMMDGLLPSRWERLRPVKAKELRATSILSVSLAEASMKSRCGPPLEEPEDLEWPVWAGVIPIRTVVGDAAPDAATLAAGLDRPDLRSLARRVV